MAVQVRYKALQVSLPSSAKQEREMAKIYVVWGTHFHLELKSLHIWPGHVFEPLAYRTDLDNRPILTYENSA